MEAIVGIGAVVAMLGYLIATSRGPEHGDKGRGAYRTYCRMRLGDQIGNRGYELDVAEARVFIGLFRGDDADSYGTRLYARLPLPGPVFRVALSATAGINPFRGKIFSGDEAFDGRFRIYSRDETTSDLLDSEVRRELMEMGFVRFLKCDGNELILALSTIHDAPSEGLDRAVALIGKLASARSLLGSAALEAIAEGRYRRISGSFKERKPPSVVVTRRGVSIAIAPVFDKENKSLVTQVVARGARTTLVDVLMSSEETAAFEHWMEDLRAMVASLGKFTIAPGDEGLTLSFWSVVTDVARIEVAINLLAAIALPQPTGAYR